MSGRDCQDDERPVHEVRVESFEISKYEVTFEEYDRFTAATGRPRADDEGWGRGRRPVINVSWEYAVAYVGWLSAQTGKRYRLPSEAEWEYAVRAGTETAYSWGNEIGRNRANCYDCGSQWDRSAPTPGDCTTCTGTYGNGCRTAGMRTTKVRLRTDRPGREVTARVASCAAARGTSIPGTSAPRIRVLELRRQADQRQRFPCGPDARPLSLHLFTSGVQGLAPAGSPGGKESV